MENTIEKLIIEADRCCPKPNAINASSLVAAIGRKKQRNRIAATAFVSAIAASIFVFFAIWIYETENKQKQIAQLQNQLNTLNLRMDHTLAFIQQTIQQQQKQEELRQLQAQAAAYERPYPMLDSKQADVAVKMLLQAERYTKNNQAKYAAENYRQVIFIFPETPFSEMAKQKLKQIENAEHNSHIQKGTTL